MNKLELKTGMIAELRSGDRGMIVLNTLFNEDYIIMSQDIYIPLKSWSENLKWYENLQLEYGKRDYLERMDIIKIISPAHISKAVNFDKNLTDRNTHLAFGALHAVHYRLIE